MRKSQFRAGVELLEHREVLSALHATAAADPVVSLRARGTGTMYSQQAIPNGSFQYVGLLKGNATALGPFRGEIVLNFAPNQLRVKQGLLIIADQGSDEFVATVKGSYQHPHSGSFVDPGAFNYTIVGGTGAFAKATGKGQLHVLRNLAFGSLSFNSHGFARIP